MVDPAVELSEGDFVDHVAREPAPDQTPAVVVRQTAEPDGGLDDGASYEDGTSQVYGSQAGQPILG